MKFFSPTSELKELLLLQHIEKKPNTTQKEIASIIDGAPSMVNVYIDNLEEKKYLIREYKSAKLVYYNITSEGIKRKNYLLISYMRELLSLYILAKDNVENFIKDLIKKGYNRILLYGAGDVAETIIGVIRDKDDLDLKIIAVVDDDEDRIGTEILGYKIVPRSSIKELSHEAILISSYTFEDEIRKRLDEIDYCKDRVVGFFGK